MQLLRGSPLKKGKKKEKKRDKWDEAGYFTVRMAKGIDSLQTSWLHRITNKNILDKNSDADNLCLA